MLVTRCKCVTGHKDTGMFLLEDFQWAPTIWKALWGFHLLCYIDCVRERMWNSLLVCNVSQRSSYSPLSTACHILNKKWELCQNGWMCWISAHPDSKYWIARYRWFLLSVPPRDSVLFALISASTFTAYPPLKAITNLSSAYEHNLWSVVALFYISRWCNSCQYYKKPQKGFFVCSFSTGGFFLPTKAKVTYN